MAAGEIFGVEEDLDRSLDAALNHPTQGDVDIMIDKARAHFIGERFHYLGALLDGLAFQRKLALNGIGTHRGRLRQLRRRSHFHQLHIMAVQPDHTRTSSKVVLSSIFSMLNEL